MSSPFFCFRGEFFCERSLDSRYPGETTKMIKLYDYFEKNLKLTMIETYSRL